MCNEGLPYTGRGWFGRPVLPRSSVALAHVQGPAWSSCSGWLPRSCGARTQRKCGAWLREWDLQRVYGRPRCGTGVAPLLRWHGRVAAGPGTGGAPAATNAQGSLVFGPKHLLVRPGQVEAVPSPILALCLKFGPGFGDWLAWWRDVLNVLGSQSDRRPVRPIYFEALARALGMSLSSLSLTEENVADPQSSVAFTGQQFRDRPKSERELLVREHREALREAWRRMTPERRAERLEHWRRHRPDWGGAGDLDRPRRGSGWLQGGAVPGRMGRVGRGSPWMPGARFRSPPPACVPAGRRGGSPWSRRRRRRGWLPLSGRRGRPATRRAGGTCAPPPVVAPSAAAEHRSPEASFAPQLTNANGASITLTTASNANTTTTRIIPAIVFARSVNPRASATAIPTRTAQGGAPIPPFRHAKARPPGRALLASCVVSPCYRSMPRSRSRPGLLGGPSASHVSSITRTYRSKVRVTARAVSSVMAA